MNWSKLELTRPDLVPTNPSKSPMASSSSSSSASSSTSISSLLSQIKAIYDSSNGANSALLLVQAKIALAQTGLLLPGSSSQHSKADMETARDILSYGALLSVRNKDIPAFERYLAQLKPFWEAQTGYANFPASYLVVSIYCSLRQIAFSVCFKDSIRRPFSRL